MECQECPECQGNLLSLLICFRAKKPEAKIPKIFQNDKNSPLKKAVNKGFEFFYILAVQGRKLLWFVSCMAFMYVIPMSFEIMCEQMKIAQRITMQMMTDGMMDNSPPQMRPFWDNIYRLSSELNINN